MNKPESRSPNMLVRIGRYLTEVWYELKKTSWPTRQELGRSTLVVLAVIIIVAVWINLLDWLFGTATLKLGLVRAPK
jgi:preprotein translocase subunit SecE